jgi:hypothetical protein
MQFSFERIEEARNKIELIDQNLLLCCYENAEEKSVVFLPLYEGIW